MISTFTFAGIDSSTIPGLLVTRVRRPLAAARRDEYVTVPGREGFWMFQEQPGARTISIEVDIQTTDNATRRAAVIALADLFDTPDGVAQLIIDDEPDRFHRCRLASTPDPDEWLEHAAAVIELTAEPYSQALTPSVETFAATSGVTHHFDVADKVHGIPEIELTAVAGNITGLTLTVNGVAIVYGGGGIGLAAGQTLTISTLAYTVTRGGSGDTLLDGSFDAELLDMATVSGDFGFVIPGANTVTVIWTGTATAVTTVIRWRRRAR